MKIKQGITLSILVFVLFIGLTACAGGKSKSDEALAPVAVDSSQLSEEAMSTPAPNKDEEADNLIGEWTQVDNEEQFAKITKDSEGYQYEDNDGKYSATFKDGVLIVNVDANSTASVYIDAKTAKLILNYQESITQFNKNN